MKKTLGKFQKFVLGSTLAYSAWVRLQDLGYSEYQGDEILTLNFRDFDGSFWQYLLTRDKGPLQFVINWLNYQLIGTWEEWVIRLPYALAGIAFVYAIFEVTRQLTSGSGVTNFSLLPSVSNTLKGVTPEKDGEPKSVTPKKDDELKDITPKNRSDRLQPVTDNALKRVTPEKEAITNWAGIIAALLAGTNGLFIAFSRITQYQAFVQLLLALIVLLFIKAEKRISADGKRISADTLKGGEGNPAAGKTRPDLSGRLGNAAVGNSPPKSWLFPLAGVLFGIAALAHYDALTFLAFVCLYFGKLSMKTARPRKTRRVRSAETRRVEESGGLGNAAAWKPLTKKIVAFFAPFLILTTSFYLPFFLNTAGGETSGYLQRRVLGGGFMPRTLYSKILMKFYMPKELIYALVILSCLSLYFIIRNSQFGLLNFKRRKREKKVIKKAGQGPAATKDVAAKHASPSASGPTSDFLPCRQAGRLPISEITNYLLPVTLLFTFWFSTKWIKPRGSTLMFYTLSLFAVAVLFFSKRVDKVKASLFAWFLASSCFYLFFNKTPRTHVYIVFIPMFILSGYTIANVFSFFGGELPKAKPWNNRSDRLQPVTDNALKRVTPEKEDDFSPPPESIRENTVQIRVNPLITRATKIILGILGIYIIALILAYNHKIFVEKNPEYIWGEKKVFGREVINIDKNIHNKVQGIFGFPQRRGWEKIAELYEKGCLRGTYATNEKARIPAFYIKKEPIVDRGEVFENDAENIILIESPVSWYYKGLEDTPDGYSILKTFYIGDHPVTRIFGKEKIYPEGALLCKKAKYDNWHAKGVQLQ